MRMTPLRLLPALFLTVAAVAGCGDDGDSASSFGPAAEAAGEDAGDEAPDDGGGDDAVPSGGDGSGTVVIDGTSHGVNAVLRCAPPDGVQEHIDSMDIIDLETLNLVAEMGEGTFSVYLADMGVRSLELIWETGTGERYQVSYVDLQGDGGWMDADLGSSLDASPLEAAGGRVTGSGTLEGTAGGDTVDASYDLGVPGDFNC